VDCGGIIKLGELGDGVGLRIGGDSMFSNSEIFWGDCWIWIWDDGVCLELAEENSVLSELDDNDKGDVEDRGFWNIWAFDKMLAVCALIFGWLANCMFVYVLKY